MYSVRKPNKTAAIFFDTCVDAKRNGDVKTRLKNSKQAIIQAEAEFERKVSRAQLHTILPHSTVAEVTKNEMKRLYTDKLVNESPGRLLYDELMIAPAHGRCPLCGHGTVATLDHHLPKSKYPSLAVTPINLIPSCRDCNTTKLADAPTTALDETIHPYFDNIESDRWLHARVLELPQTPLNFYVETPSDWDHSLSNRVKKHFKSFQLGKLYTTQAARELITRKLSIYQNFETGGTEGMKNVLKDNYLTHKAANLNSWQTAMYEALLHSEWYCSEGFKF
jgi:5-methylcytosine-specific restriction endonuclease McrA